MRYEAINELKKYTTGRKNTEKIEVSVLALDRIIFALEQETCGDAISRQAVIEHYSTGEIAHCHHVSRNNLLDFIEQLPPVTSQPCGDCISRQAVLDKMKERDEELSSICPRDIRELPPVTPQPKMGRWIINQDSTGRKYGECSECTMRQSVGPLNYCPNCGAKMEAEE